MNSISFFKNIWDKITNNGTSDHFSRLDNNNIRILNYLCLLFFITHLPFSFIFSDNPLVIACISIPALIIIGCFFLIKYQYYNTVKHLLYVVPSLAIYIITPMVTPISESNGLTVVVMLLSYVSLPFLVFKPTQKLHIILSLLFLATLILSYKYFNLAVSFELTNVVYDNDFNKNIVYMTSFATIACSMAYYMVTTNKFTEEASAQNEILQQQHEEIITQRDNLGKLNHTLVIQNRKIEDLNNLKSKILTIIAHDLKSPFHTLSGTITLLEHHIADIEMLQKIAPELKNSVENTYLNLDNVLKWAIGQMDGHSITPIYFNVQLEVGKVVKLYTNLAESKKIKIENLVSIDSKVFGDPNHINLVLRNLLSNAIKFTHENGIIKITAFETNTHWLVSVIDNGMGMKTDIVEKLFNPQEHITTRGTNKEKGTGIGLMMCKDYVELNGGNIAFSSNPENGTTFTFSIPKEAKG